MTAIQRRVSLDLKTQYGLGLSSQDDEIIVGFFWGGGGAGTGLVMGLGRPVGWFQMGPDCTHHSRAAETRCPEPILDRAEVVISR